MFGLPSSIRCLMASPRSSSVMIQDNYYNTIDNMELELCQAVLMIVAAVTCANQV